MTEAMLKVRVWDLPTRVFHWLLAAGVVGSVVTAKIGGSAMAWHFRCGYLIMTLLAFRLVWGVVGGRWSRFASFIYSPATLLRYVRGHARPEEHLDVGHSPLGAGSVFALLAILLLQVGTGLIADDEISNSGPLVKFVSGATSALASGWHKNFGQWLIIGLVLLHLGAIAFYRFQRGRDLVGPMLNGDKMLAGKVPGSADAAGHRGFALTLAALCAALVGWLVSLGG
ncbi:MAG: cytochrome b/b6 domain-containing protein [Burkholderiaceae bacterium]